MAMSKAKRSAAAKKAARTRKRRAAAAPAAAGTGIFATTQSAVYALIVDKLPVPLVISSFISL